MSDYEPQAQAVPVPEGLSRQRPQFWPAGVSIWELSGGAGRNVGSHKNLRCSYSTRYTTIIPTANSGQKLHCNTTDTFVRNKWIYLVLCSATARYYHEAAQRDAEPKSNKCPQVTRENKNRIRLIDPRGQHSQSSRTNRHLRRPKEIGLTGRSLTHFLNLWIKLIWLEAAIMSSSTTLKSFIRRSVVTQRRAACYNVWSKKIIIGRLWSRSNITGRRIINVIRVRAEWDSSAE